MSELRFDDRVAIVTGAGRGIGRAHAVELAARGARVVVADFGGDIDGSGASTAPADDVVGEIRAAGGEAVACYGSVAIEVEATAIVETALDTYGRLDVVVNNAGIHDPAPFEDLTLEQFRRMFDVHFFGTMMVTHAAWPYFLRAGYGRVVNTTSVSGMMGNFGQANYAAAKAGIYGLTRTMSIELQKHKITVNALAPIAKTRMTEDLPMFQHGRDALTPDHIAPAALFLASPLCGDRTGYVLAVAGARMYAFKVIETPGKFKDGDGGVWTPQEIADNWDAIVKA